MFSLGQRLRENPSVDFSGFSGQCGMYVKLVPIANKEKRAITDLLMKQLCSPIRLNEYFDDPHLTVIWSKVAVPKCTILGICDVMLRHYSADVVGASYWPGHDNVGYLVLNVKSFDLVNLHEMIVKLGGQHSFTTYEPHVTLASRIGPLTPVLRNWMERLNSRLASKPMPLMFSSVSFSDL